MNETYAKVHFIKQVKINCNSFVEGNILTLNFYD